MTDYQNYKLTPLAAVSVSVPRVQIEAEVHDSTTGDLIADFTGANALIFPGVVTTLTNAQQLELGHRIARFILDSKAGL